MLEEEDKNQPVFEGLARRANLVGCNLVSTDLESILSGLCDAIAEQQAITAVLKEEVAVRQEESQLLNEKLQSRNEAMVSFSGSIAEMSVKMDKHVTRLTEENEALKKELEEIKATYKERLDATNESIDSQLKFISLEVNENTTALRKESNEVKEAHTMIMDELATTRKAIASVDLTLVHKLRLRIVELEKVTVSTESKIEEKNEQNSRMFDRCTRDNTEVKKTLNSELFTMNDRLMRLEKQAGEMPELQDLLLSGEEIGLTAVLQTVMRNSRRLDSFDKQLLDVRKECENVATAVVNVHEVIHKFNHQVYDSGVEIEKHASFYNGKLRRLKSVLQEIGNTVGECLVAIAKLGDVDTHTTTMCAGGFDELVHLMTVVFGRSFGTVHTLDEVALEAQDLVQKMREIRSNLDVAKLVRGLDCDEMDIAEALPLSEIEPFERTMDVLETREDQMKENSRVGGQVGTDPIVLMSLEELRVRMREVERTVARFSGGVETSLQTMKDTIKGKMDVDTVDRVFAKLESAVGKMRKSVDGNQVRPSTSPPRSRRSDMVVTGKNLTEEHASGDLTARSVSARQGVLSSITKQRKNPVLLKSVRLQNDYPDPGMRPKTAVVKRRHTVLASQAIPIIE